MLLILPSSFFFCGPDCVLMDGFKYPSLIPGPVFIFQTAKVNWLIQAMILNLMKKMQWLSDLFPKELSYTGEQSKPGSPKKPELSLLSCIL